MKCPYCKKQDCVRYVVFRNAENYGGGSFHLPCEKCGKMLYVHATRTVKIISIHKSDKSKAESDF